jgi:V-type H+-transporting ATPase subunit D
MDSKVCATAKCGRALTGIKIRLKGAQRGHSLLKKKSDALTLRFRAVLKQIIKVRSPSFAWLLTLLQNCLTGAQNKTLVGEVLKEAHFFIAESKFIAGNFGCVALHLFLARAGFRYVMLISFLRRHVIVQNVEKANLKVKSAKDNVAGGCCEQSSQELVRLAFSALHDRRLLWLPK